MNIVKLLPVSFLHGQISCLIECLILLQFTLVRKQLFLYRSFLVIHPKVLHKICTSFVNSEREKLDA